MSITVRQVTLQDTYKDLPYHSEWARDQLVNEAAYCMVECDCGYRATWVREDVAGLVLEAHLCPPSRGRP